MIKKKKKTQIWKKNTKNRCSFYAFFFCSINSKKKGKTPFFLFSKKYHFENTEKNKNKFLNQISF